MSKLTQRELAARLGLSYSTVSRVFNDDPRISEATRERVMREAERLGFRRHPLARALRLKRSFAIGVVVVNSLHSYWGDILAALERHTREHGYHVIICHRDPTTSSTEVIRFLLDRQVDAIILAPDAHREDPRVLQEVEEAGTPLLLVDRRLSDFPAHYLGTDSRTGSRIACEHLLELGHRRIAFLAGPEGSYTADNRLQGYQDAMRAAGIPDAEQIVIPAGWNMWDGREAAHMLLSLPERPTAVQAVNDPCAIGCYLELRNAGVRVPEDLSLVGYSGDFAGELLAVPLTTVAQPGTQLGERAAEIVLRLIDGEPDGLICEELRDELVIRASTAPPVR